jgi:hypothetical protein
VSRPKPTPRQRLDALTEQALDSLEAEARTGKAVDVAQLNGLRRLVEAAERAREQDEQLERLNALTRECA